LEASYKIQESRTGEKRRTLKKEFGRGSNTGALINKLIHIKQALGKIFRSLARDWLKTGLLAPFQQHHVSASEYLATDAVLPD
jgi:hypothetical protein